MSKKKKIIQKLEEQGLMPLFFHEDIDVCINILKALYSAGVRLIEYTNRGNAALGNFKTIKKVVDEKYPHLLLGAGTIKNKSQAEDFIKAGADFIISPALIKEVFEVAENENILWIPGCMTPTEISKAEHWGISLVKLFPGNILGPGYLTAIRELFAEIKFMPTGGVDATHENLKAWFDAGASAVGMGGKLINRQIIESKLYEELTGNTKHALRIISEYKK